MNSEPTGLHVFEPFGGMKRGVVDLTSTPSKKQRGGAAVAKQSRAAVARAQRLRKPVCLHRDFADQMRKLVQTPHGKPWDARWYTWFNCNKSRGTGTRSDSGGGTSVSASGITQGWSPARLHARASKKWHEILSYVVGMKKQKGLSHKYQDMVEMRMIDHVPESVRNLLNEAALLRVREKSDTSRPKSGGGRMKKGDRVPLDITPLGYEWMLKNARTQLWLLMVIYLQNYEEDSDSDHSETDSGGEFELDEEGGDAEPEGAIDDAEEELKTMREFATWTGLDYISKYIQATSMKAPVTNLTP